MQVEQTIETFRELVRRWVAPIVAWIPDISAFPQRRLAAIGVIASVLVHLLLLLLYLVGGMVIPEKKEVAPLVPPHPLVVEILPPPPDPLVPLRRQILDAKGLEASPEKPVDAQFESDKDMLAASTKEANGLLPLPTQDGRTDLPGAEFADHDVQIGVAPDPQPETVQPEQPQERKPQTLPPTVSPLYTPQPIAPETLAAAEKAKPADEIPDPAKTAKATPPPLKMSDKPGEETLAMRMATPKPAPVATPAPEPVAPVTPPVAVPAFTSRVEESMRKTAIEGALPNNGKAGVNAVNGSMGRWHAHLSTQLQSLWTLKLKSSGSAAKFGTVCGRMKVREDGKVLAVRLDDDGSLPHNLEIILELLQVVRPEKLPADALPSLQDGVLEIPFSFTLY